MNKKGRVALGILAVLILVVLTSGVILFLLSLGIITVDESSSSEPILNAEFIPVNREDRPSFFAVKGFNFCSQVDERYRCLDAKEEFTAGSQVHFLFVIESSTYNGEVSLIENYRLKSPDGDTILDINEKDNFNFNTHSSQNSELVALKDFFIIDSLAPLGEYELKLIIQNPLLEKSLTLTKTFEVISS